MMQSTRIALLATASVLLLLSSTAAAAEDFEATLARVDQALKSNPSRVPAPALSSCADRRAFAIRLYNSGQEVRAERGLKFCFTVLKISETAPEPEVIAKRAVTVEDVQARAAREIEQALALTPNVENGLEIYRSCAMCHMPEGWGLSNGSVPQIAGQHPKVVIKQLADIRAGNRDNPLMLPYATVESIGSAQGIADVAGYIDTLEISVGGSKGAGDELELGEKLYRDNCARCHGAKGEGDDDTFVPRIQAQHYDYLVRQFESIRSGKRRNANADMVTQIAEFEDIETRAVLDYVSRLDPPEDLQAPSGWLNPDFPDWFRGL